MKLAKNGFRTIPNIITLIKYNKIQSECIFVCGFFVGNFAVAWYNINRVNAGLCAHTMCSPKIRNFSNTWQILTSTTYNVRFNFARLILLYGWHNVDNATPYSYTFWCPFIYYLKPMWLSYRIITLMKRKTKIKRNKN